MVSSEMVTKLNLDRLPHDSPYQVSQVNGSQTLMVNEQAYVDFQIGDYKDRILCDGLPTDCCHVLLGKPWQFDREAIYDGCEKTYLIKKDGKTFKLTCLQANQKVKGTRKMVMFGRKEPIKRQEVEAIQRLENIKATELLEGVMIKTIMCPFVEDKINQ